MRKILLAGMVAVMMLFLVVPISDDSDAANTVSFDGYILIDGKKYVDNDYIEVSIYTQMQDGSYNIKMSRGLVDGYFKVNNVPSGLLPTSYYLNINLNGFEITNVPDYFYSEMVEIDVSGITVKCAHFRSLPTLNVDNYTISSDDLHAINMASASGSVNGRVTADNSAMTALNGVKISIIDPDKNIVVASSITSNGGTYNIENCPIGYYQITAETGDYKTMNDYVDITTGTNTINITMESDPGNWFGMDLPHVLMVIAGIMGVLLIATTMIVRIKMKNEELGIVYDDSDE